MGFTLIEVMVVLSLVTIVTIIMMRFWGGQYRIAVQETACRHIAHGAHEVAILWSPTSGLTSWWPASREIFANAAGVIPTDAFLVAGGISQGLYIGLTIAPSTHNLNDRNGSPVTLTRCQIGSLQFAIFPGDLPPNHDLHDVAAEWISPRMDAAGFIAVAQEGGVFACLERS